MNNDSMQPLCAGNWKAHGDLTQLASWAAGMGQPAGEVILCPPHPLLVQAVDLLGDAIGVGAQDVATHGPANQTGNTTAQLVADCGVGWTLVGHSERRAAGETDAQVAAKLEQVSAAGLKPILCIGESLPEREAGRLNKILTTQLDGALSAKGLPAGLVVAYEPVWAIGTGVAASAQEAQEACQLVRKTLEKFAGGARIRLLYGGSVKTDNAVQIMAQSDIDGLLVGGASLDPVAFTVIAEAVAASNS